MSRDTSETPVATLGQPIWVVPFLPSPTRNWLTILLLRLLMTLIAELLLMVQTCFALCMMVFLTKDYKASL